MSPAPDHTHSVRLTFAYSGDDIRLVHTERVAMIAPGVATPPPEGERSGYWIEVRDAGGTVLYHRPLHNPVGRHVEVFGDAPGDPMYHSDASAPEGEFEVLVPDLPDAASFVLHGPAPEAGDAPAPSGELLAQDFDELRPGDGEETPS